MNKNLKVLFAAILIAGVFTQDKICEHLGFGQAMFHEASVESIPKKKAVKEIPEFKAQLVNHRNTDYAISTQLEVDWQVLMDIEYKPKYFPEIGTEMYAPVFSKEVKAFDKKEVTIEGYIIPLGQEGESIALSFYPYASCFFCGKASPASVISMYLKDKDKFYKMDDYKKFKGTLHLNHDNPNEFYYILRDAVEE